jgi:hypothetical protein
MILTTAYLTRATALSGFCVSKSEGNTVLFAPAGGGNIILRSCCSNVWGEIKLRRVACVPQGDARSRSQPPSFAAQLLLHMQRAARTTRRFSISLLSVRRIKI